MKIGELARRAGISVRMLRWYEEQGLLLPHRRPSGYREYDNGHLRLLLVIKRLQAASLPITTITELLPCIIEQHMSITNCPMVIKTLEQARERLRQNIDRLQLSEASLDQVIEKIGTPISDTEKDIIRRNIEVSAKFMKPILSRTKERNSYVP